MRSSRHLWTSLLALASVALVCIATPVAFCAAESQETPDRKYLFTLWAGGIDAVTAFAGRLEGELRLSEGDSVIGVAHEPFSAISWVPSEAFLKARPTAPASPVKTGHVDFALRHTPSGEWILENVRVRPDEGIDIRFQCIQIGRFLHLALAGRSLTQLTAFDLTTVSDGPPTIVKATPLSSRTHAETREPHPGGSDFAGDAVFTRADGPNVELVALHYESQAVRAVFAQVWAGGAAAEGDRRALAVEGAAKAKALFESVEAVGKIEDRIIPDFLEAWNEWRSDVTLSLYVLDISPASTEPKENERGTQDASDQ